MNRPPVFALGLFAWLGLELAAFFAVAQIIGVGGALLLGLATSFAGAALLRQTGTSALKHVRSSFEGAPQRPGTMIDGLLRALAAILLIIPGFISDLVGLALAAPSLRQILARRFGGNGSAGFQTCESHGVVDLAPEEWASIDQPPSPSRR